MIHWYYKKLVDKQLNGSLSEKQYNALLGHLENCARCKAYYDQQSQFEKSLLETFAHYQFAPEKTALLKEKINQSPPVQKETAPAQGKRTRITLSFSLASAAIIILIVVTGIIWSQMGIVELAPIKVAQLLGEGVSYQQNASRAAMPISTSIELPEGGLLQTDTASFAKVTMSDRVAIWLDQDTQVEFHPEQKTVLKVNRGQIYVVVSHLPGKYKFRTPSGEVHVHGTEFIISVYDNQSTRVECARGVVGVNNSHGNVTVPAEFYTILRTGQPPAPPVKRVNPSPLPWKTHLEEYGETNITDGPDWYPVYYFKKGLPDFIYAGKNRPVVSGSFDAWYLMGQDKMNQAMQQGYKLENIPFFFSRYSSSGMVPVYELIHDYEAEPPYGVVTIHFFTTSDEELAFDLNDRNRWTLTGIMGYTYPPFSSIHRLGTWGLYSVARFGEKRFDARMTYHLDSTPGVQEMKGDTSYVYNGSGAIASPEGKLIPPVKLSPTNNQSLSDSKVLLLWKAVPHAFQYELQLSPETDFTEGVKVIETDKAWAEIELTPGRWYWRVRTRSNYGIWGEFGTPGNDYYQFEVLPVG